MSRGTLPAPEPEKNPDWTDAWQPFHDHWEEILNLPLDALELAQHEKDSEISKSDLSPWGVPDSDLKRRRKFIDALVSKGNVGINLRQALNDLREVGIDPENHEVFLGILEDILRPYIHSRLYEKIFHDLRAHTAFQDYYERRRREEEQSDEPSDCDSQEVKDYYFLFALAKAMAIKLGINRYRNPKN